MLNHARNVAQMRAAKSLLDKLHHRQEIERETTNPKRRFSRQSVFASCVDRDILKSVSDDAEIPRVSSISSFRIDI